MTSRHASAHFVRSAILVDDRAYSPSSVEPTKDKIRKPPRIEDRRTDKENEPSTPPEPDATKDVAHDLNADAVVRSFAREGVLCSIRAPDSTSPEEVAEQVLPVAEHADLVILDWVLDPGGGGEGEETSEIVVRLAQTAMTSASSPQFRAIVIYTGSPNLKDILSLLKERFEAIEPPLECVEEDFALRIGSVRIAVYAKPDNSFDAESPEIDRIVGWDDLVHKAIDEFAALNQGMVRATALVAVATVRDETYRILERFRRELDAPYLTHRGLLPEPDDAIPFLLELIASEVAETIEGSSAGDAVSEGALKSWLDVEVGRREFGRIFQDGHEPSSDEVMALLRLGYKRAKTENNQISLSNNSAKEGRLTQAFSEPGEADNETAFLASCSQLDREFAALVATRVCTTQPRFLRAGHVLRLEGDGKDFWLCIQPYCDSVRLNGPTRFPLAPLEEVEEQVEFAMLVDEVFRTFRVDCAPREITHLEFEPTPGSDRIALPSSPCQIQTKGGKEVKVLGELRFSHIQRILNRFGETSARVGPDVYEWLRIR